MGLGEIGGSGLLWLIAHQTIVYSQGHPDRSRLNAVLMGGMFIGRANGTGVGRQALALLGWQGACGLAVRLWSGARD